MHQHTIEFSIPEMEKAARAALINAMEDTCHVAVQAQRIVPGEYVFYVKHSKGERIDAVRAFCADHTLTVTAYED